MPSKFGRRRFQVGKEKVDDVRHDDGRFDQVDVVAAGDAHQTKVAAALAVDVDELGAQPLRLGEGALVADDQQEGTGEGASETLQLFGGEVGEQVRPDGDAQVARKVELVVGVAHQTAHQQHVRLRLADGAAPVLHQVVARCFVAVSHRFNCLSSFYFYVPRHRDCRWTVYRVRRSWMALQRQRLPNEHPD